MDKYEDATTVDDDDTVRLSTPSEENGGMYAPKSREVARVAIRVPPFWPEEPEIWFAQIEGQFANSGITSDTSKFNCIIGHLDNQYTKEVKDVVINPPATGKYEKLKTELIKRLTVSNEKKLKQLLMHEELGDRKPSTFLRHLSGLAGKDVPDDFLKIIWISRLPGNIQTVLAGRSPMEPLVDLADLADRIADIVSTTPHIAAAACPSTSHESEVSALTREVAELRRQVQQLTMHSGNRSRPRSRRQPRSRGASSSSNRSQSSYRKYPVCWYHSKFGENANRCVKPCDFKSVNSKGSR